MPKVPDFTSGRGSLTPKEFQRRHGISHATFWRMVRDGRLRVVRLAPKTVRVPMSEDARFSGESDPPPASEE